MTSDWTVSIFCDNKYVGFRGHAANTHGIFGECNSAPDSEGCGTQLGVVVYDDGFLRIACPGSQEVSKIHFTRLIVYNTFYKLIRMMGLEKATLLSCPSELTLG